MNRHAVWFLGPGQVDIREEDVPLPGQNEVLVRTRMSAISPGTELLFYQGLVPEEIAMDASISALAGLSRYPIKYGYSAVGEVIWLGPGVDPAWQGQRVFVFHPHESVFIARVDELMHLPADISWQDAVFLPNMETALNLVMDAAPMIGEIGAVFGLGIVGLLTSAAAARYPLALLAALDPLENRRVAGITAGIGLSIDPSLPVWKDELLSAVVKAGSHGVDWVIECSGAPQALDQAIQITGYEGRIVVGSWYGKKPVKLDLGGRFHRSRIRMISSQVTTLASGISGRWTKERRFQLAWEYLKIIQPSRWITQRFPILQAAEAYRQVSERPAQTIQVVLEYDSEIKI